MKTIQNKILVTVLIAIALVLIIGGGVLAYVYFGTDTFKTPQELFVKYLSQDLQELEQTVSLQKLEEIEEKLEQNKYEENMTISYEESNMQITIDTQNDPINKKMYKNFSILTEGLEHPLEIEYMLENERHSLRFTEIVKQFLSIENRDLKSLATNLGIDEEIANKIPDTIYWEEFSLEKLNFTEEEKEQEINKYANVLYSNIPAEKYIKNKDSVITLNGKTVTTNAYVLTLSEQELKYIVIKLLETLKQDEIILAKVQIIDDMTYEFRDEESKQKSLKESFAELVQTVIDEMNLEDTEQGEESVEPEDTVISIYEEKGTAVRIKMEQGLDSITIDTTQIENQKQIDVNFTSIGTDNTQQSTKATILKETENKLNIKLTNIDGEEQSTSEINVELTENENNTKIDFTSDSANGRIVFTRNINFVDEINYKVALDSSNNKILNDMSSEQITNIFNAIGPRITTEYIEPLQPVLRPILSIILIPILLNEAQDAILNADLSEAEIAVFNSKFTSYEGENIPVAQVNELLNIVLTHNIEEANQMTERYVVVTGDVVLDDDATSIPRVDGEKNYNIEAKIGENGLIYEIVITEYDPSTSSDDNLSDNNQSIENSEDDNIETEDNVLDRLDSAN